MTPHFTGHNPVFFQTQLFSFMCGKVNCMSLFVWKGQLYVLPSEIILEPKRFALKNNKFAVFSIFESKMGVRSAFLCQPVGLKPEKYG
jgi:hypothetical protein